MPRRCCEFVDSRLRRSPPDRASAVPYGQAGENAMRFPRLAHRSAAAHKLHSTPQQDRMNLISGNCETSSRLPALDYSPRKLSRRPAPSHTAPMAGNSVNPKRPIRNDFMARPSRQRTLWLSNGTTATRQITTIREPIGDKNNQPKNHTTQ